MASDRNSPISARNVRSELGTTTAKVTLYLRNGERKEVTTDDYAEINLPLGLPSPMKYIEIELDKIEEENLICSRQQAQAASKEALLNEAIIRYQKHLRINHTINKIRVHSIDLDGALLNEKYYELYNQATPNQALLEANKEFFEYITTFENLAEYSKIILMNGSQRQSVYLDKYFRAEACHIKNGTIFPAGSEILQQMCTEISSTVIVYLDGYLLADTLFELKNGESFEELAQQIEKNYDDHKQRMLDTSQLIMLYSQIHKMASENIESDIEFYFHNHDMQVLGKLIDFFTMFPEYIPFNVVLRMGFYNGNLPILYGEIKGLEDSIVDFDYQNNTLVLFDACTPSDDDDDDLEQAKPIKFDAITDFRYEDFHNNKQYFLTKSGQEPAINSPVAPRM